MCLWTALMHTCILRVNNLHPMYNSASHQAWVVLGSSWKMDSCSMKLEQLRQPWMNDRLEIPTLFNDIITHLIHFQVNF